MLPCFDACFIYTLWFYAPSGVRATIITAIAALHRGKSDQIHLEVSDRRGMDVWFRPDSNNSAWSMLEFEETQIRRVELKG